MILDLIKPVYAEDAIIPGISPSMLMVERGVVDLSDPNLSVGNIISGILPYIYVIAGLLLLVLLIAGGFGLMTSAGNPDKIKAGYGKITSALIGFFIVFISYIVVMLVETIFGVDIL